MSIPTTMQLTAWMHTGGEPLLIQQSFSLKEGRNRIVLTLPEGKLMSVCGTFSAEIKENTAIFANGFQTWTHCPEHTATDKIKKLGKYPKFMRKHFGMDRYGDEYFARYPEKAGILHGESYCYLRDDESFRLFASCSEDNGYTMFYIDANHNELCVERDVEGLNVSGEFCLFDLFIGEGEEKTVFDAWFSTMGVSARTDKKIAGYSSWYNRYQDISEQSILTDLKGSYENGLRKGDIFQIDDGWEPAVGDWLAPDETKFPNGLRPIVDEIHDKGFVAGLWLAPFVAQQSSVLYREHKDWFMNVDEGGEAWRCGSNWGGFFALDFDNSEVRAYLKKTFERVFEEWDFDLVKLDFLYAAAPVNTETEPRGGRMNRAMRYLRELCGDKLILGCGVPVMSAFGLVDYCRISCDVGLDWNNNALMRSVNHEIVSTEHAIENTIFRRELNGRAYLSDPDVFFLRDENIKLNDKQKRLLAKVNSLLGGVLFHSDDMSKYRPEMKAFYEELRDLHHAENVSVKVSENAIDISYGLNGEAFTLSIDRRAFHKGQV